MVVCLEQEEGPVDSRSTAVSSRHTRTQIRLAAVVAAFLSLLPAPCWAADYSAAIVADLTSGQVLFSQAAEEPRFPASLTKMMTLYVLFEGLERRRYSLESPLIVSEYAAAQTRPSSDYRVERSSESTRRSGRW